jgi:prolyl 4-hydroxylase
MTKLLTPEWEEWISLNVARGCDKDGIFRILMDEGFDYQQIADHMGYRPSVDIATVANPLKAQQAAAQSAASAGAARYDYSRLYIPNATKLDTDLAEFYVLDDFLNAGECEKLVALIRSSLRPSTISNPEEADSSYRTSSTCDLGTLNDEFMQDIDDRICRTIGLNPAYSEIIQGQYYEIGQEFKAHTDYFEAGELEQFAGELGQRTYTFFIYLNDVEEGGETEFPVLGQKIRPRRGRAVIWNSLTEDGVPNPNTLHRAHPVRRGNKAVITKWFRSRGSGPMYTKEANELTPSLTRTGFSKTRLDPALYAEILEFYRSNCAAARDEHVEGGYVFSEKSPRPASQLVELPDELRQKIHSSLAGVMSDWCGRELEPTYVYGIRVYRDGAVLKPHRDRLETHVVSAIINVDQEIDSEWPLFIEDNLYRGHEVLLKPGDVLFYEGSRLMHGRPTPLHGASYANIFCHYRLAGGAVSTA